MKVIISTLLLLVVVLALTDNVLAVDRSIYKTCSQSSFCRRNRGVVGQYIVDRDSLMTGPFAMSVDLINTAVNNKRFILTVRAIENDMFHFEIDERDPLHPRHKVEDALHRSPSYDQIHVAVSFLEINVYSRSNRARIDILSFEMEFYRDGVSTLLVNSENLMRFEHLRERPDVLDPNEDPDSWEETFLEHTDSKPRGPEGIALDFYFPKSHVFFGIPEHADSFILKETKDDEPYRLYNLDVPNYEVNSRMALYGGIPVIYAHGPEHTAGVYWQNTADTYVDILSGNMTQFISEAGIIDVFVLLGPTPNAVFSQYTDLTGVGTLPPIFSLGMHQSRWNYFTREELLEVVDNYDKNDIPLDSVWLDIEYTDGRRYFTWNLTAFPRPAEMISILREGGRHLTYIIDPHIKIDPFYFFYQNLAANRYFVYDNKGEFFEGECWPGPSHWIDFTNPSARQFYARHYMMEVFSNNGVDTGVWNDMNEPAVFDVAEKTIYRDMVHYGGIEHRVVHNKYGYLQTKATYDGLMRRGTADHRPFILTRSFFAGSQRYTAVWTGDNTAGWEYLKISIPMCLSISAAGISFCGSDIGGFFGNPDEELQVRWTQAAIYQPFVRNHAEYNTEHREPYLLSPGNMEIARDAIRMRYAMLPFWYTLFYEHTRTGQPIMRAMLSQYPTDTSVYHLEEQYMLSDKLLVAPVMEQGATRVQVYLPSSDDVWYDFDDYTSYSSGQHEIAVSASKIPVFQRASTIIPKKEQLRNATAYMQDDPVSLLIALDDKGHAVGTLFVDDEHSFAYQQDFYAYYKFEFHHNKLTSSFADDRRQQFVPMNSLGNILIAGLKFTPTSVDFINADESVTSLEFENKENYVVINANRVLLGSVGWNIQVNSAITNFMCGTLSLIILSIHLIRLL